MAQLKVALNFDLLYDIAEGLISKSKHFNFQNCNEFKSIKFMLANNDCMLAFMSFFSRMREIDVCARPEGIEINFFKSRTIQFNLNWSQKETLEHQGPYRGDPWFLAFLIKNGKINLKKIFFQILNRESENQFIEPLNETTSALQSLCILLNLKGFNDFKQNRDLNLDFLEISDLSKYPAGLQYYLAMNAAEVKIFLNMNGLHCFPEIGCARVNAVKTHTLAIVFSHSSDDSETEPPKFPTAEWIEYFTFIFSCCPSLKNFLVRVALNQNLFYDMQPLLNHIHSIIKAMNDEVLTKVWNINPACSTEFELQCFVEHADFEKLREVDQLQHELFNMGNCDKEQFNNLEIARVINLNENSSIRFSIFGFEDEQDIDEYREIIDDAFDDYDNYGEYDTDEGDDDYDYDDDNEI